MDGIYYHPNLKSKRSRSNTPKRRRQPRKKPQANPLPQEWKKNKKKNWRKPYSPSYRIPKLQKDAMENVFNMARTLMEFKDKEEQRMGQPHFPKISFSPDVLNTLTEI
ncbi:hypothetical protein O181_110531 [Austropuccinia psidii MF-1]|uniref:Uncharacterized protein n=1 Tax=Austropuccinia psidii MF-1 TaxID=1389203 RepID=A0A9Q3PRW0_9BASI|nr:hypothetical protein [Austropuccinia psidii MF-1]